MANVLTAPRFWKKKAILAKAEATVGTDPIPAPLVDWIEARNVTYEPIQADTADRNVETPYMGNGGKVIVGHWAKLSFEIALAGPGVAGTAPKISPLLLACAFAETTAAATVTYNLVSDVIGAVTFYINIDGIEQHLVGCRGTATFSLQAKGIPTIKFEFDAVYQPPVAVPPPVVDRTGWPYEQAVNATNTTAVTVGATTLAYSSVELALANQIAKLNLPGPQREVVITDRKPTLNLTVLAPGLNVFDPFALMTGGTVVPVSTTHGTGAGRQVKLDAKARVIGVSNDQVDGVACWKLSLEPTPVAGNDEITLTYL